MSPKKPKERGDWPFVAMAIAPFAGNIMATRRLSRMGKLGANTIIVKILIRVNEVFEGKVFCVLSQLSSWWHPFFGR